MLSSVLLPLPDGPTNAANEPSRSAKSMPRIALTSAAPVS